MPTSVGGGAWTRGVARDSGTSLQAEALHSAGFRTSPQQRGARRESSDRVSGDRDADSDDQESQHSTARHSSAVAGKSTAQYFPSRDGGDAAMLSRTSPRNVSPVKQSTQASPLSVGVHKSTFATTPQGQNSANNVDSVSPSALLEKFAGREVANVFRETRRELQERRNANSPINLRTQLGIAEEDLESTTSLHDDEHVSPVSQRY